MAQDRITTPSSSAGLVRFYDINASLIQLDPRLVVGLSAGYVLFEVLLHVFTHL